MQPIGRVFYLCWGVGLFLLKQFLDRAVAAPFAATGVWLTAKRLQSLGWAMWWAGLFFVPGVNLIFFGFLSLAECTAADRAPPCGQ